MQINAKIEGVPWVISNLPLANERTMIIGIEVYSSRGKFSILGVCGTLDNNFSQYSSFPKINANNENDISKLSEAIAQAIKRYHEKNNYFPQKVLIFKEGISDGQKNVVLANDIPKVKEAFKMLRKEGLITDPQLIYIGVNKRTNARFYAINGNRYSNPSIGTVIDRDCVEASEFDFYLLPAKTTQGVMRPTHFRVIYDDSSCTCDEIIQLSLRMCFSYYNWSGSIRIPAPCQYAHKLAYLYGERAVGNHPPIPHPHWGRTRSLYFL